MPVPVPFLATARLNVLRVNVAVTFLAAVIVTVQAVPFVLSHPDQEVKVELASGAAVRVTGVLIL